MIERGFLSSPSGTRDAYRVSPANLPNDKGGPGTPVGKGYETLAIIEIVDAGGRRIGPLGLGLFEKGGFHKHAEAEILKILSKIPEMREGRMIVIVDTPVCPSCTSKLGDVGKGCRARCNRYVCAGASEHDQQCPGLGENHGPNRHHVGSPEAPFAISRHFRLLSMSLGQVMTAVPPLFRHSLNPVAP